MIRITPTSIAHCIGFCLVAIYGVYWFTNTAVPGPDRFMDKKNQLIRKSEIKKNVCDFIGTKYIPPVNKQQSQVVGYYKNDPNQPILATSKQGTWTISLYDINNDKETVVVSDIHFSDDWLSFSYQPIYNLIAYPNCEKGEYQIIVWSVADGHEVKKMTALNGYGIQSNTVDNLFFDPETGLISYTTNMSDISSRVVLSYEGRLLQSIDESPGTNRQLEFMGYLPDSKQLVYRDFQSNDRLLYSANSISLARQRCLQ